MRARLGFVIRTDTRQISGHFKPEVSQTPRLIAVEQDKELQEILAEALNMVVARYGKQPERPSPPLQVPL
ncbi:MAG: ribbon-helix-helix domain-containing protein [Rhodopila sp.]